MAARRRPLDWSAGEALALATLALGGTRIRLSGQDTARGTFSQRHAVLHDAETGEPYMPLANLGPEAAPVEILKQSALGTRGPGIRIPAYSLDDPRALVLWEAPVRRLREARASHDRHSW